MIVKVGDVLRSIAIDCQPHCKKGETFTVVKVFGKGYDASTVQFDRCSNPSCEDKCLTEYRWCTYDTSFERVVEPVKPLTREEIRNAVPLCSPDEVKRFFEKKK